MRRIVWNCWLCAISMQLGNVSAGRTPRARSIAKRFLNSFAHAERTLSVTLTSIPITTLVESICGILIETALNHSAQGYLCPKWFWQLDCETLMLQFPLQLLCVTISFSFRAYRDSVGNPRAWLLTDVLYRPQMFPTTVRLALAEVDPRLG